MLRRAHAVAQKGGGFWSEVISDVNRFASASSIKAGTGYGYHLNINLPKFMSLDVGGKVNAGLSVHDLSKPDDLDVYFDLFAGVNGGIDNAGGGHLTLVDVSYDSGRSISGTSSVFSDALSAGWDANPVIPNQLTFGFTFKAYNFKYTLNLDEL